MSIQEPLVSVIVPIYNLENAVSRCLNSLIKQTYNAIEIIAVDDGSTDNSLAICQNYAADDERIVVLAKENEGVSSARNLGLDKSRGEYVVFVDGDDFVLPDYIENIVKTFLERDVDIVVARFASGREKGVDYHVSKEVDISGEYSSIEFERLIYSCKNWYEHSMVMCVWGKGYKRKVFNDIRFEGRILEDYAFTDVLLSHDYEITVIDKIGYIYCYNPNSLTHKTNVIEKIAFLKMLEKRLELFAEDEYMVNNTCALYCNMYIEYYYRVESSERALIKENKNRFISCINTLKTNAMNNKRFFIRMFIFRLSPMLYRMITAEVLRREKH